MGLLMARRTTRETYHHGDLRNALVQAGTQMLAETGVDGLSMRRLAERLGVSHNAPYQHFADKEAILAAIAAQGFRALDSAIADAQAALPVGLPSLDHLKAAGAAYVTFVLANPHYVPVMFGTLSHERYPELSAVSLAALDRLAAVFRRAQASGEIVPGSADDRAVMAWTMLHGLSSILAVGKLPGAVLGRRTPQDMAHAYLEQLWQGFLPR
jgi:AcrR family transcriptional regulator